MKKIVTALLLIIAAGSVNAATDPNTASAGRTGNTKDANPTAQLLTFGAQATSENAVQLNWATASERNNAYFTIERSADGINWEEVMKTGGAANTADETDYEAMDYAPLSGIGYYRLKETGLDGKSETFQTVSVKVSGTALKPVIEIYPNPASGAFTLIAKGIRSIENTQVRILDSMGYAVFSQDLRDFQSRFDMSAYNSGTYVVELTSNGEVTRSLIVKN